MIVEENNIADVLSQCSASIHLSDGGQKWAANCTVAATTIAQLEVAVEGTQGALKEANPNKLERSDLIHITTSKLLATILSGHICGPSQVFMSQGRLPVDLKAATRMAISKSVPRKQIIVEL